MRTPTPAAWRASAAPRGPRAAGMCSRSGSRKCDSAPPSFYASGNSPEFAPLYRFAFAGEREPINRRCRLGTISMRKRVVVTGMGAITPLGHNVEDLFKAQLEGRSGIGPITLFNASRFPTRFAAEVKDFDLGRHVKDPERWADSGANSRFAAAAAQQALTDAGLLEDAPVDRTRFGVYLGAGEGIQDFHHLISLIAQSYQPERRAVDAAAFARDGLRQFHPGREFEQELHTTPGHLAAYFGLEGPTYNCLTACAAGSQASGEASELIRHGDADLMLSGGAHSMIHPLGVTGFNLLTALSTRNDPPTQPARPFD